MAYAILDNYPEVGCIAWIDCHIVYKGVDYEITNQYTDAFYVWWDFDYPNVFQAGNEFPELDDDDVLVFLNKNGTHLTVPTASVVDGGLIVPESIHTNALAANSITGVKILAGEISAAHLAADSVGAVAIAAGAVTAEKINVENLAAISANLGVVNAGFINVGDRVLDITDMATAHDGQVQNDANVTAYFPFDDSLYDSKNLIQCTFNRDSVAYLPNGTQVGTDIARYDTARIVRGVLIEEGTTNLLTENESSVETDLIGLSSEVINGTGTFTRDTTKKKYGNASAKLTCSSINPGGWMDIYVDKSITGGLAYTFSVNFLASVVSGTRSVRVFVDWYNGSTFLSRTDTAGVTVSPSMSDFIRLSVSDVAPANASRGIFVLILGDPQVGDALYWDGAQLEQKPYPTSWTLGGTTRAPESLTIPTAGIFQKGNWTVDVTYIPNNSDKSLYKLIWMIRIDGTNLYQLYIDQDTGLPTGRVQSDSVYYTIQGSEPVIPGNKYVLTFSGDGATLSFYCNGDLVGSIPYTEPVGDLPSEMQIGTASYGASLSANGIIDELRFSKVARTLEEHQAYYHSQKGYTDIEPIIRAGQEYEGFMITRQDGAKAYCSDGGYTIMNSKGVTTKGGNFKIFDDKNILVMDGKGVNPLETSGWGITSGLTFAVQSITPTSNYIEVVTTSSRNGQQTPFNLYLNDVSRLGNSGVLETLNNFYYTTIEYNGVDAANKCITVTNVYGQSDIKIGDIFFAEIVDGVQQPAPSAIAHLLIKGGSAVLRNGEYVKFPNDIQYDIPISVGFSDTDGWQFSVLFINGNGQITHLNTGTAGIIENKWRIVNYPAHPRYNNIGTGTPDPSCIVLGVILYGGNRTNPFAAHELMHPDFRDERALKVNNLVYELSSYYGDVDTVEKSILATSTVSVGNWGTTALNLSSGQKYEVAVPIGKGKRMALLVFRVQFVKSQDNNPNQDSFICRASRSILRSLATAVSIGYNNYFIDSYCEDSYGKYVIHESSGVDLSKNHGCLFKYWCRWETYFLFFIKGHLAKPGDIRTSWFAFKGGLICYLFTEKIQEKYCIM